MREYTMAERDRWSRATPFERRCGECPRSAMTENLPTLAVTGGTGGLGGLVARGLAASGMPQRLIVRDLSRAPDLPGATVVQADYADLAASARALVGVETLFMVSATESDHRL